MLSIEIYENSNKVTDFRVQKQFMVLEANDEIYWETDGERSQSIDGGEIHLWIRVEANREYKIVSVRKDWSMSIDGQSYPSQVHLDVGIGRHIIELSYRQYRFVCRAI